MDIFTIIGLLVGFGGLLFGFLLEAKFNFAALGSLIQPVAASVVFGGTLGAILITFPPDDLKLLPGAFKSIFKMTKYDPINIINTLSDYSDKARKNGLLSLEEEAKKSDNEFLKKGLSLLVDGIDGETIKDILERETELYEKMQEGSCKIFEAAGGYSPTMGVIGTVMGMVNILGEMGGDTNALAHMIATAFVATLYGVLFANVVYLPFAGRIKAKMERKQLMDDLIVEGLLSIQSGESPRIIKEKLNIALIEQMSGKKPSEPVKEE